MNKIAVTVDEAVAISGMTRTALYQAFKVGGLTPRKSGRRTLIIVRELEEYIRSLPSGTTKPE